MKITDRTVLIMDEVDGMSSGDRGGVGALNAMIKKSKVGYPLDYILTPLTGNQGPHHLHRERPRGAEAETVDCDNVQSFIPEVRSFVVRCGNC